MQNLLGHSAAWQGRSLEVRLPLIRCSASELLQTAGETAAETELLRPETHILPSQERLHRNFDKNRKLRSFFGKDSAKTTQRHNDSTKTRKIQETFHRISRNFTDACKLDPPMSSADSIPTMSAAGSSERCKIPDGLVKVLQAKHSSQQNCTQKLCGLRLENSKQHDNIDMRLQTSSNRDLCNSIALESKSTCSAITGHLHKPLAADKWGLSHEETRIQRRLASGTCQVARSCGQVFALCYLSALCLRTSSESARALGPFSAHKVKTLQLCNDLAAVHEAVSVLVLTSFPRSALKSDNPLWSPCCTFGAARWVCPERFCPPVDSWPWLGVSCAIGRAAFTLP